MYCEGKKLEGREASRDSSRIIGILLSEWRAFITGGLSGLSESECDSNVNCFYTFFMRSFSKLFSLDPAWRVEFDVFSEGELSPKLSISNRLVEEANLLLVGVLSIVVNDTIFCWENL